MVPEIAVILLYCILYFVAVARFRYALFLFVFHLPVRPLVETELVSPGILLNLFSIILLFHFFRVGDFNNVLKKRVEPLESIVFFSLVFFTISLLTHIRENLLLAGTNYDEVYTARQILWRIGMAGISMANFIFILKSALREPHLRKYILSAMFWSAVTVVFSTFFSSFLQSAGINVREPIEHGASLVVLERGAGLLSGGDVNSVSTFLNLMLALVLIIGKYDQKPAGSLEITAIAAFSAGILYTGSRMGIAMLFFLLLYYFFILKRGQVRISISAIAQLFIISAFLILVMKMANTDNFGLVFERIRDEGLTREITSGGSRYALWAGFMDHTFSNSSRLLWGSNEIYYSVIHGRYLEPHNFFINIAYINGIPILAIFLWSFFNLFISFTRVRLLVLFIPLTAIVLISMMIINSDVFRDYYILSIGIIMHEVYLNRPGTGNTVIGNPPVTP